MDLFIWKAFEGTQITLKVDTSDSIGDVKAKIQQKEGIPADRQKLIYDSKRPRECIMTTVPGRAGIGHLKDKRTLSDYNIGKKSVLRLIISEPLTVHFDVILDHGAYHYEDLLKKTFGDMTLNVQTSDTINTVKKKMRAHIDQQETPADRHRMEEWFQCYFSSFVFGFKGKKLKGDSTLSDYNIQNNDVIRAGSLYRTESRGVVVGGPLFGVYLEFVEDAPANAQSSSIGAGLPETSHELWGTIRCVHEYNASLKTKDPRESSNETLPWYTELYAVAVGSLEDSLPTLLRSSTCLGRQTKAVCKSLTDDSSATRHSASGTTPATFI